MNGSCTRLIKLRFQERIREKIISNFATTLEFLTEFISIWQKQRNAKVICTIIGSGFKGELGMLI